jgi:hypothetical protein
VVGGQSEDVVDSSTVGEESAPEPSSEAKDVCSAPMDGGMIDGGVVEGGVLGAEGATEGDHGGIGEVDDEQFGSDEKALEATRGHRFLFAAEGALILAG